MLWDDYVEAVTEGIRNRKRAREVRREVRDHLLCLREQFMACDMPATDAEARAMEVLGPADTLARHFRDLDRPHRPLWPVAVSAVGVLWALGSLGVPGAPTGPAVFLLLWSLVWGGVHLRSFSSLAHALHTHRTVASGAEWGRLFPRAWPSVGAGAAFGVSFALLYGLADLAFFGILLAAAAGVAAFIAASRHPWSAEDDARLNHPQSTGLAAIGVLLVLIPMMTFIPGVNFAPAFVPYGILAQHLTYPELVHLAFVGSIPASGIMAALYFSAACVVQWLSDRLTPPGEAATEATLSLE